MRKSTTPRGPRGVIRKGFRGVGHLQPYYIDSIPSAGMSQRATAPFPPNLSNENTPALKPKVDSLRIGPRLPVSPADLTESATINGDVQAEDPILDRFTATGPDRFLTEEQASLFLGLSRKTLQAYRQAGTGGPAYHVLGSRRGIRYRMHELFRWALTREVRPR